MIQEKNKKINIYDLSLYISCGLIGVLLFLLIYGYKILDFTYVDWLFEEKSSDLFQAQIGFEFFRRSPWKFPLGSYNSYPYPSGTSIVFTDSIPLMAIFFKFFQNILPDNFQYFGLWGLICFFLQGFLSSILLKKFIRNNKLILLISPIYTCSTSILWRLFRHSSLGGQWIIILAFIAWAYRKKLNNLQMVFVWSSITALSVLIHVYFLVMIGIIMCGCLLENILTTKKLKWNIITFCSAVFYTVMSFYIIGGFEIANFVSVDGVGTFSMNLNALFNSFGYSKFFYSLPNNFGQYEGFQYLGGGVILLLFLVICTIDVKDIKDMFKKDNIRKIIPISIVILILTIIALSPVIVINTKTILDYSHPFITKILGIVRCTGRFFWPVWYIIVTAIFVFLYRKYKNSRKIYFIFGFCVIIQMLDIVPSIPYSSEALKGQYIYDNEFSSPIWKELSTKTKHIVLMTEGIYAHQKLAWYAAKNNMTMNIGYFSRTDTNTLNQYMYDSYVNLCNENIEEDTIYCIPFDKQKQNTSYTSQKALEFDVDGYKVIVSRNLIDEEKYKDLIKPEEENAYKKIQEERKILMKEENAPEIILENEMIQIKNIEILNTVNEIEVKGILKNISQQKYYSYNNIKHPIALYYSIYNKDGVLIKNMNFNQDFRYFFNKTILPSDEEYFSFKIDVSDIISGEYIIMLDLLQEEVLCFSNYDSSNYKYTININH